METNCTCHYCGKGIYKRPDFIRKYKLQFCGNGCASKHRRVTERRDCFVCGRDVIRKPSEFKRGKNVYCSRDCYYEYNRRKGAPAKKSYDCDYCKKEFKRFPSQTKGREFLYCSTSCKDKHNGELIRGEFHPSYNHNMTAEERQVKRKFVEYYDWRRSVYDRDDYTCQCCGDDKGGNLVAHHIYNYSEHEDKKIDLDNGITLCKSCHKKFHDEYGYTKNDEKQLFSYIQRYADQLPLTSVTK